jgi:hypothetical protein
LFDTLCLLTADLVHYSTNMPKPLKNLYNEPLKKARGRFVEMDSPMRKTVLSGWSRNPPANRHLSTVLGLASLQTQKLALRAQTVCAAAVEFNPSEAWGPRRTVTERRLTLHSHFGSILCSMAMKKLSNPPIII